MSLLSKRSSTPSSHCTCLFQACAAVCKALLGALVVLGACRSATGVAQQMLPGWTYVGQQSSEALQVTADIAAAPGAQVQVNLLPVHTEWSAYVNDADGSPGVAGYAYSGFGGQLTATVLSGDGFFASLPATVPELPWQTLYATFQAGSMPSTVQFSVQKADGSVITTVQEIKTWTYSRTESAMRLGLGTAGQAQGPGGEAQVTLAPRIESWDVFVTDEGDVKTDNYVSTPAPISGGSLSWETISGDGSFVDPPSAFPPDGGGLAANYLMGTSAAEVRARFVQDNGEEVTESITLLFTDGSTSWSFLRNENLINVTLTTDHSDPNIQVGETVGLFAHAERTCWEVWQSTSGTTASFNTQTAPAAGAWCSISLPAGYTLYSAPLDGDGNASASFEMQPGLDLAEANVAYDSSTLGYASLQFVPVESGGGSSTQNWHFDHLEATLSAQMSGSDSLAVSLAYTSWEVWASDGGQQESRNFSTAPAAGASVNYGVVSGSGMLASLDGFSDGNGCSCNQFSPTQPGDAIIQATASFAGLTATATLTVSTASMGGGDDGGAGGTGGDGSTSGNGDDGSSGNGPGGDNPPTGDGNNGDGGTSGGENGGNGDSAGTGDGSGGDPNGGGGNAGGGSEGGGGDSGNYPDNNSTSDPWQFLGNQANVQVSIITNSFTPLVSVEYYSWEMWQNAYTYAYEQRNISASPAIGAQVGWVVTQGDGSVGMCMAATDATGTASAELTAGSTDSTVTVYVSFAGCTASTTVFVPGVPPPPPPPPLEDMDAALAEAEATFIGSPEFQNPVGTDDGALGLDPEPEGTGDDDIPPPDETWSDGSVVTWEQDYISWSEGYPVERDISYSLVETSAPITVGLYTFQFEVTYTTTFDRYRVTGTAHYTGTVKHADGTTTHIFKDSPCSRVERRNVRPEKSWPRLK